MGFTCVWMSLWHSSGSDRRLICFTIKATSATWQILFVRQTLGNTFSVQPADGRAVSSSTFLIHGPNFSNLHSCTFGFVWNQVVPLISAWTQLFLFPDVEGVGGFSRCQGTLQEVWCPRNRLQLFFPFWWHSSSSYSSCHPAAVCLLSGWIRTPHSCLLTGLD